MKILSFVLSLLIVFTMIPVQSFAQDSSDAYDYDLLLSLGIAAEGDVLREKKRKNKKELFAYKD